MRSASSTIKFLAVLAFAATAAVGFANPAKADDDDFRGHGYARHVDGGWQGREYAEREHREHEWREHERMEHEMREHYWRYNQVVYAPYAPWQLQPRVVYAQPRVIYAPPPPPGIGLFFRFDD